MNLVIILVSILASVSCRPQTPSKTQENVQVEKQEVHLVKEASPTTILKYLNNGNRNTNQEKLNLQNSETNHRFDKDFKFSENPFQNPILDYVNKNSAKTDQTYTVINTNPQISTDDAIPGQFIKRKVTHQQTMIIPLDRYSNINYYSPINYQQLPYPMQNPQNFYRNPQGLNKAVSEDVKKTLENQTIQNVKNIVNTQFYPLLGYQNQYQPYSGYENFALPYYYGFPIQQPFMNQPMINRIYPDLYHQGRPNRQWQWPLAQYFPIIIRDPVQQIVNAFTSMVEYGEQANANCAPPAQQSQSKSIDDLNKPKDSVTLTDYNREDAAFRTSDDLELPIESRISTDKAKSMNVESKSIQDLDNEEYSTKNLEAESKTEHRSTEDIELEKPEKRNNNNNNKSESGKPKHKTSISKHVDKEIVSKNLDTLSLHPTPLKVRQETKFFNPIGAQHEKNLLDSHKNDDEIKIFSKDNTGNGIFIHKLKVNHGGVAIAGPGGVATAGHGGTAIVGPNGIAFTQPDSIAIAGVGAKVVAVNPDVNLTKLIESTNFNRNNFSSRIGKVVAIGPVVYYNRG